jgi:chaperonin GroES
MATATADKTVKASKAKATSTAVAAAPIAKRLRPLGDRVVLRPGSDEKMTKSGIVIPDTAKERPQEGEVIAVGPGRTLDDGSREKLGVKTGERVLYAKYAGTEFKLDGEDLLILSSKDILAVLDRG